VTKPKDPTLTHDLLAKALGVTVTTVKSYRRKFPEFWRTEGVSKPLRFPPESLVLCRRIQQHFKRGLSVAETRKRLGEEFQVVAPQAAGEVPASATASQVRTDGPSAEALARMEGLLEGLFTLHNRTHSLMAELVAKLDTLADRLDTHGQASLQAGAGRSATKPAQAPRVASVREAAPKPDAPATPDAAIRPPQAFLDMPVVVRSDTGEFLGVTLKSGGPVTLARFEAFLVERARSMSQARALWLSQGQDWTLRIDQGSQSSDHHFAKALTPRGNTVARFASLSVGGKAASEHVLQAFLRQVKETLDA
jgi:hypothetical protein